MKIQWNLIVEDKNMRKWYQIFKERDFNLTNFGKKGKKKKFLGLRSAQYACIYQYNNLFVWKSVLGRYQEKRCTSSWRVYTICLKHHLFETPFVGELVFANGRVARDGPILWNIALYGGDSLAWQVDSIIFV